MIVKCKASDVLKHRQIMRKTLKIYPTISDIIYKMLQAKPALDFIKQFPYFWDW